MRKAGYFALGFALMGGQARAETLEPGEVADQLVFDEAVTGLTKPTALAFLPDGRMVTTEKGGTVRVVDRNGTPRLAGTFPVDMSSEKGLLNVLVHPDFAKNRLLFFYYSASEAAGGTRTDRHRVVTVELDTAGKLDMSTEKILLRGLRGPANHDGGAMAFGPDGMLYVGVGDTGCNSHLPPEPPFTPTNYFATCLTNANGKILRINLDGTVPATNPLVGKQVTACGDACSTDAFSLPLAEARPEIWAWGFRNPWRFSFDARTGNLWVGDVGEVTYEELDVIPPSGKGRHYGWPLREGGKGRPLDACRAITPNAGDCVDPKYFCFHGTSADPEIDGACGAIMGGVIVDSCTFPPAFRGRYFYGDAARPQIYALEPNAARSGVVKGSRRRILRSTGMPVHFVVGPDGALYYADIAADPGASFIGRIAPKVPAVCPATPDAGASDASLDAKPPEGAGGAAGEAGGGAGADGAGGTAGVAGASAAGGRTSLGGSSGAPANAGRDAGRGTESDAGRGGGMGEPADASVSPVTGGKSGDDGGCGCRTAAPGGTRALRLSLLALALVRLRRRRR